MLRVISQDRCHGFYDSRLLYTPTSWWSGTIGDAAGKTRIRQSGDYWNRFVYDFPGDEPSAPPLEPQLTWYYGVPLISPERIESDGFSGRIHRSKIADQRFFNFAGIECRFDIQQSELFYEVDDPRIELRATLLAFKFYRWCLPG